MHRRKRLERGLIKGKKTKNRKEERREKKLKARNMVYPVMTDAASFGDDDASSSARWWLMLHNMVFFFILSALPSLLYSLEYIFIYKNRYWTKKPYKLQYHIIITNVTKYSTVMLSTEEILSKKNKFKV